MKALLLGAALMSLANASNAATQERSGRATHYGVSYHGQLMGCPGAGRYSTYDPSIVAVPPSLYQVWPCGTALVVRGPAGAIVGTRQDACPGCDRAGVLVDLSEAGIARVCGPRASSCQVTVRPYIAPAPEPPPPPQPEPEPPDDLSGAVEGGPYYWGGWRLYAR